jgi:hypothetical protein
MTKDFEGTDLVVGDSVVYIDTYTRQLKRGVVVGFTKQNVVVEYVAPGWYNYHTGQQHPPGKQTVHREYRYVVKLKE